MKSTRRVWLAPAYVLHQYAYRDSSRIVEVFTGEYGRVSLFARGAAGPKSALKGVLRPFQRLLLSWSGRHEAGNLAAAEIDGRVTSLTPARLMSGFYLNELILKLIERQDPHPGVFEAYQTCIEALGGEGAEEASLRRFEKRLLNDLGYGLDLLRTREGAPVQVDRHYRFALQTGPQPCTEQAPGAIHGQSLSDLASESFEDARSLRDAKRVLRAAIDSCLEGRTLKSREVLVALRRAHD